MRWYAGVTCPRAHSCCPGRLWQTSLTPTSLATSADSRCFCGTQHTVASIGRTLLLRNKLLVQWDPQYQAQQQAACQLGHLLQSSTPASSCCFLQTTQCSRFSAPVCNQRALRTLLDAIATRDSCTVSILLIESPTISSSYFHSYICHSSHQHSCLHCGATGAIYYTLLRSNKLLMPSLF